MSRTDELGKTLTWGRIRIQQKYERLHDVFPIQFLEKYTPREGEEPLTMPDLEEDEEWEVEEVKSKTTLNKETYYLVKWEGWPAARKQFASTKRPPKRKRRNAEARSVPKRTPERRNDEAPDLSLFFPKGPHKNSWVF